MSCENVLKLIKENDIKFVDLRFCDTIGKEQHVTVPATVVDKEMLKDGKMPPKNLKRRTFIYTKNWNL